ncbi:MAG: N-acetyltransferase [Candidatus Heimdallarchaeota archaeon]|nr:N-acetyltransferase [Candidatus Heimdallarchaeota archaeon]
MNYSLRLATEEDISQLIELRIEFIKEVHVKVSNEEAVIYRKHLESYFREHMRDGSFLAWIALDSQQNIIATSGLVIITKPPQVWNLPGKEAYIMNMYTKLEWRKKGIGSALLEKLLEESKKRGINEIALHATSVGRSLYEKYGFKPNHHYMDLFWE